MSKYYRNDRFEVDFPENWDYDICDSSIAFFAMDDGVGAINISTIVASSAEASPDELFAEYSLLTQASLSRKRNGTSVYYGVRDQNDRVWRYWLLWKFPIAVLISYNCERGDFHLERQIVDEIVDSINVS